MNTKSEPEKKNFHLALKTTEQKYKENECKEIQKDLREEKKKSEHVDAIFVFLNVDNTE